MLGCPAEKEDSQEEEEDDSRFDLPKGTYPIQLVSSELQEKETNPPKRYTQASLIRAQGGDFQEEGKMLKKAPCSLCYQNFLDAVSQLQFFSDSCGILVQQL